MKIPKLLLAFFLISQICFGLDFGFGLVFRRIIRLILQRLSVLISITYMIILIGPFTYIYTDPLSILYFLEYAMYFIILKRSKYTVYNLIIDINWIYNSTVTYNFFFMASLIVYFVGMFCVKLCFHNLRCIYDEVVDCDKYNLVYYTTYAIPCLNIDVISVTQIIVFYYIYRCIKHLKKTMESSEIDIDIFEKRYKAIADCYDKIKPLYNMILIVQLISNVPKMMITLWHMLFYIKVNSKWFSIIVELTFAFHSALQLSFPAIVAEMVNAQVDSIKCILNECLMKEMGERNKAAIIRMQRYMETRRLQHLVWRIIPVDRRLLMSLFSFCTTYFIIIIQFTHLYE